jgi:hypothetical protein
VFCPETQQYCIITVLEHNGYKFKEGVTIHTIINELKLVNGFVPVTKIKHLLEKISSPVQLIIHPVKDGVFSTKTSNCTRVPNDKPEDASVLHIGNILNHYFSVSDLQFFKD